jgi:hypothetical protein
MRRPLEADEPAKQSVIGRVSSVALFAREEEVELVLGEGIG